ncbi:hypothetical protein AKJ08_0196 [Vulgatibacter incomptus]|uniref:Uncharacterized protein n=1 Tax=Vulgatibacter incomptus TaxID=1391653 RepID=A0A0K1P9M1_9BACT|nr:hypothetical protein AKJ08_0196 [Vulgatibacter incomptus]
MGVVEGSATGSHVNPPGGRFAAHTSGSPGRVKPLRHPPFPPAPEIRQPFNCRPQTFQLSALNLSIAGHQPFIRRTSTFQSPDIYLSIAGRQPFIYRRS